MEPTDGQMNYNECLFLTTRYLQAQKWTLVAPEALAEAIWQDLGEDRARTTAKVIERQVWQRYAEILHERLCLPAGSQTDQAWIELRTWIEHQTRFLVIPNPEPENLAQEVIIELHQRLKQAPLRSPRAFFVFALNTLRTKNIDDHRRRSAAKRGEAITDSIEVLARPSDQGEDRQWDESLPTEGSDTRQMEDEVAEEEIKQQLRAFFQTHIQSSLQREVALMHFVDGLEPAEIAHLLGKQPHEIRLAKARLVQALRNLPIEEREKLLHIIGL